MKRSRQLALLAVAQAPWALVGCGGAQDAQPQALTKQGEKFSDLSWAPTANVNAVAMAKITGNESDLCLGKIDASVTEEAAAHRELINYILTNSKQK